MGWTYRVVKRTDDAQRPDDPAIYQICEVYDDPFGFNDHIVLAGWTLAELRQNTDRVMEAFNKPVIDAETGEEVE